MNTWLEFQKLYGDGKGTLRGIGVSNFSVNELKELMADSRTKIKPQVNQVEFSPFCYQKDLLEFCQKENIVLTGFTPLAATQKKDHPVLVEIAKKHNVTWAQVMLRWALQHGVVVIPKSTNEGRINQNANLYGFELDNDDMKKLDCLDENHRVYPVDFIKTYHLKK